MSTIGRPWPAKLSQEQIAEAKMLRQRGLAYKKLAERYGVSLSAVWKAVNGRSGD
jgi:transcriptional regulator with XRE-family HTH domain